MIGLFGSQTNCRGSSKFTTSTNAFKMKSKATNMLLDNQINEKLNEVNNNLIKKRPHFFKFFNENFLTKSSATRNLEGGSSSDYSYKRYVYGDKLHRQMTLKHPTSLLSFMNKKFAFLSSSSSFIWSLHRYERTREKSWIIFCARSEVLL